MPNKVSSARARATTEALARHWDAAYARRGVEGASWYQAEASVSLELIDALGITPDAAVVDVGGGPLSSRSGWLLAASRPSRCSTSPPKRSRRRTAERAKAL